MTTTPRWLDRPLRVFLAAWAILFALTASWSIGNAMTAAPDEPAHMIKAAATARGELLGEPGDVPGKTLMTVPDYVVWTHTQFPCQRLVPSQDASCIQSFDGSNEVTGKVDTAAGAYNPVYYAIVGWPTLVAEDEPALYGMRLMSALLSSGLLAAGFAALSARARSSWALAAAAIGITPMVLFIGSSVNISAMELPAGFALAAWLAVLLDERRRVSLGWTVTWIVATGGLLICSRAVAPVWAAVIAGGMLLDGRVWREVRRSKAFWGGIAAVAAIAGGALAWTLASGSNSIPIPGWGVGQVGLRDGIEFMLSQTFSHAQGYVGNFGWLDTPLPRTVPLVWGGLMFAVVAAAIIVGRGWGRVRVIALTVATILLPAIVQGASFRTTGYIWQDRYLLAVVLALLVAAGCVLDDALPPIGRVYRGRTAAIALMGGLWVMQLFSFMWNERRYVTGIAEDERRWSIMLTGPLWQPPGTWMLWAAVFALASAIGYWLIGRAMLAAEDPAPIEASDDELAEPAEPHGSTATSSLEIIREDA